MASLYVLLAGVIIAAPIIFSFIICVPKWWSNVVEPIFSKESKKRVLTWEESEALEDRRQARRDFWTKPIPRTFPIRWVWAVPIGTIFFIVALCVVYYGYVASLIERKCPYTPSYAPEEWDSYTQKRVTFGSFKKEFKNFIEFVAEA